MQRTDSLEKTLMLGKIQGRKRRGQQRIRCRMASPTQWTWVWASSGCWWWTWRPGMLQFMGSQRVRHDWETELNWLYFITGVWEMHRTTTFFKKTGAHSWHPWFIKYIEVPLPLLCLVSGYHNRKVKVNKKDALKTSLKKHFSFANGGIFVELCVLSFIPW